MELTSLKIGSSEVIAPKKIIAISKFDFSKEYFTCNGVLGKKEELHPKWPLMEEMDVEATLEVESDKFIQKGPKWQSSSIYKLVLLLQIAVNVCPIYPILCEVSGVIAFWLTAYFFDFGHCTTKSNFPMFLPLLAIVVLTLTISLAWTVLCFLRVIVDSRITQTTDMFYHIGGGLLLIIGGILWIFAFNPKDYTYRSPCTREKQVLTLTTGSFGIIDGCVYLAVAFFVWWRRRKSTNTL